MILPYLLGQSVPGVRQAFHTVVGYGKARAYPAGRYHWRRCRTGRHSGRGERVACCSVREVTANNHWLEYVPRNNEQQTVSASLSEFSRVSFHGAITTCVIVTARGSRTPSTRSAVAVDPRLHWLHRLSTNHVARCCQPLPFDNLNLRVVASGIERLSSS